MLERIRASIAAVSYTHLDVYKRQGDYRSVTAIYFKSVNSNLTSESAVTAETIVRKIKLYCRIISSVNLFSSSIYSKDDIYAVRVKSNYLSLFVCRART